MRQFKCLLMKLLIHAECLFDVITAIRYCLWCLFIFKEDHTVAALCTCSSIRPRPRAHPTLISLSICAPIPPLRSAVTSSIR